MITLRARSFEFQFPSPCLVMGVLNVTPDSFSDGGKFMDADYAVEHALRMESQGAAIIDIGGESTRPRSLPVEESEELHRVIPVLEKLAGCLKVPISIDTMKEKVAREAVAAGASIINDVGSHHPKPGMWAIAAQTGCAYVAMHAVRTPRDMQDNPSYGDVVAEVRGFLESKIEELSRCGIGREQIIVDPGIGFGKTATHNLRLLGGLGQFASLGRPLLVGVSRKSFLGSGMPPEQRLPAGLACACLAVESGANIIRAHDVAETLQAVRMAEQILGEQKNN